MGGLYKNMKYPVEFWQYNVAMNENLMRCCKEAAVQKLVSCLSTCIFPRQDQLPHRREHDPQRASSLQQRAYAYAKRMIDVQNRIYHAQYGCQFTSGHPHHIYGPHDNYHLQESHVIPA